MMKMESLIAPQSFAFPLKASSRDGALTEMVDTLVDNGKMPSDLRDLTLAALKAREERLTTAIGDGIALPHASVPGLPSVITLAGGTPEGIDCEAPDGRPTHIFFMVLIPSDQYSTHLRAIAGVTRFFRQDGIVKRILDAKTPEHFRQCFL